ncbi:MAG: VTT domain-containing protein [Chloroflexi bacterium]|nr:VTT domain-containing protein [Chloroflexota bacterium]
MIDELGALASGSLTRRRIGGVMAIALVVAVSAFLVIARPDVGSLAVYGYPGLFILMAASSASVLFPLPGFATVMAAGTFGNPLLIALFAGLGSATGELTGYLAGCGGRSLIEARDVKILRRFEQWLQKYGFFALFLLAAVPNPAFDLVGIAAGSMCYPARKFLAAVCMGNVLKYLFLAYVGKTFSVFVLGA